MPYQLAMVIVAIVATVLGCASTGGEISQGSNQAQIADACMKVEVPRAIAGNSSRAAMKPEDALAFSIAGM